MSFTASRQLQHTCTGICQRKKPSIVRSVEYFPTAMIKQQGDASWPIVREVEGRPAPQVLFIDALWGILQYPFSIFLRPANDSGNQCTTVISCRSIPMYPSVILHCPLYFSHIGHLGVDRTILQRHRSEFSAPAPAISMASWAISCAISHP